MKVSVITMLAIAMLATASPVCESNMDTSIDSNELTFHTTKRICLRPCFPKKPHCPPHFRPRRIGWRCCKGKYKAQDDDDDEYDEFDDEF